MKCFVATVAVIVIVGVVVFYFRMLGHDGGQRRTGLERLGFDDDFAALSKDAMQGVVVFLGGYETDPRDGGRPVALIAAALGVKTEVF